MAKFNSLKCYKMSRLIIKGGVVWHEKGLVRRDVEISGENVSAIAEPGTLDENGAEVIDAKGCHVLPGFVDVHVHFREPGFSAKETIATGSRAAAAGGFTTVCTMPNVNPVPDSLETLAEQLKLIEKEAVIKVIPFASITKRRMGKEVVNFRELMPFVAGFSDDGTGVQDEQVMRKAMLRASQCGALIAAHCEVESMLHGGYIHDGEYCRQHGHRGISSQSEWAEVARNIGISAQTDCRLHICHVSTEKSVSLIRKAKQAKLNVTCETAPHYLAFCDEDLQEDGRFKMNPPLRSRKDMEALRRGVIDGTIDVIATDHAPHTAEEKSRGLEKSAMGVVGLETAMSAVYTFMVKTKLIPLERLVQLMSDIPRRLLGLPEGIAVGNPGDIVIVNFNEKYKVDPEKFITKGRATPFEGIELQGSVKRTICSGETVYVK